MKNDTKGFKISVRLGYRYQLTWVTEGGQDEIGGHRLILQQGGLDRFRHLGLDLLKVDRHGQRRIDDVSK